MKLKIIAVLAMLSMSLAPMVAKDLTGIKIYVNPGHGGYDNTPGVTGDDRFVATIPFPNETEDAFWESSCNLVKGQELKRLLENAGATVKISRTANTSNDDKALATITSEANNWGADAFISIHSNQLGTNTGTNYFLNLYNADYDEDAGSYGYLGKSSTLIAECKDMATKSAEYFKNNNLTTWDASSTYRIVEDYSFLGYTLGVIRTLEVPGFVLEGSFHDYEPETHRLLNDDYAKLTAWDLYRFYCDYFEADKPTVGVIAGSVKDGSVEMSHQYYNNWKSGTHDRFQPLNGATITLLDSKGEVVNAYTTDQYYNGVFVFWDLTPGKYTVRMEYEGMETVNKEVEVTAAETTSFVQLMYEEIVSNIQATSLKGSQTEYDYTISFMLNATPTSLAINLYDENGTLLKTIEPEGNFVKGENKVVLSINDLAEYWGKTLKWSVLAKAEANSSWRCISAIAHGEDAVPQDQMMCYPNAVAVDNNPESDYFGRIYMLNGTNTYTGSRSLGVGIYAYNPVDFSMINEDDAPYTGNVSWKGTVGSTKSYVCLSPHTMTIDDAGYVYVSDWTDSNSGVWVMDPANPTGDFIPVFNVGTSNSGKVYNDNSEYVHGSISGICVVGTGADRVLYTVDEDYSGGVAILKYKIGEISSLPYTGAPEVVYLLSSNSTLDTSLNSYLAPDRKGGVWFVQRNYSESTASSPYYGSFSLLHFTANGYDEDFGLFTDYYSRSSKSSSINTVGIATNTDGSRLAISVYAAIGLKTVEFNADGTVNSATFKDASSEYIAGFDKTLTQATGNYMNHMTWGVAFDAADNLYVADWSDYFQAYSLGKSDNSQETMSKYKIDLVTVGVVDVQEQEICAALNGNVLNVTSSKALGEVIVYNMAGAMISSAKTSENAVTIDASAWVNGAYLVKSGDYVTKIIK